MEEDHRPAREPHHPHPDQGQFLGDGRQRPVRALLGDLLRPWRPYPRRPARLARTRTATASSRSGTSSSCSSSRRRTRSSRELPNKSIDTGMGLERIAAVLQGVHDNYDTDTFKALIARQRGADQDPRRGRAAGQPPGHRRPSARLRLPGRRRRLPANEGRGYVLRRIMRRAMRHAHSRRQGTADAPPGAGPGRRDGRRLSRAGPRPAADRGDADSRRRPASARLWPTA